MPVHFQLPVHVLYIYIYVFHQAGEGKAIQMDHFSFHCLMRMLDSSLFMVMCYLTPNLID